MNVQQALRASPAKQAIGDEGKGRARVIVTRLKSRDCDVSVIAAGSVFFHTSLHDEKAIERVLREQVGLQGIAFEPVRTCSFTASPFRRRPKSPHQTVWSGWLLLLFHFAHMVMHTIRVVERKPRTEKKAHRWSPEQVLQCLHFLTRHVLEQQSLVFSLEDLQSTWLTGAFLRLYRWSLKLVVGAGSGLIFGLGCEFCVTLLTGKFSAAPSFVMMSGLLFGGLCGLLFRPGEGLRPEGTISWKRGWSRGTVAITLFGGLGVGAAAGLALAYLSGSPVLGWILFPCFVLLMGLPFGLFYPGWGICWKQVVEKDHYASDEGRPSVCQGLPLWLMHVLLCGLYWGLFGSGTVVSQPQTPPGFVLFIVLMFWTLAMLPLALLVYLPACLSAGPAMVVQPLLLRFFLRLCNWLPWDLRSALEQAVESGLLHKVGKSYRLSSRLLLSYFDSLDQPFPPHITVLQEPFTVSSFPTAPGRGQPTIITYDGLLLVTAQRITMHWGHNDWKSITDTAMRRSRDGTWRATITVPPEATVLNLAFYDQSNTWDNRQHNDYRLLVRDCVDELSHNRSVLSTGDKTSRNRLCKGDLYAQKNQNASTG